MSRELVVQMSGLAVMSPEDYWNELNATVFKGKHVDNSRKFAFLGVCNSLGLNPVQKEIYYMEQAGTWTAVISVDGWIRIATRHPDHEMLTFEERLDEKGEYPVSVTAIIKRKSWSEPMRITEYYRFCKRNTKPWNDNPLRMLRHKAVGQAVRYAYGISAVSDLDDWERWNETGVIEEPQTEIEPQEKEINPVPESDKAEVLNLISLSETQRDLDLLRTAIQEKKYNLTDNQIQGEIAPAWAQRQAEIAQANQGVTYESAN